MAKKKTDKADKKQEVSFVRTSGVKIRIHHPDFLKDLEFTQARLAYYVRLFADFLVVARGESYVDGDRVVPEGEVIARQRKYVPKGNPIANRVKLREFYDRVVGGQHNFVTSYVAALYNKNSDIGRSARLNRLTGEQNDIEPGRSLCRELLDAGVFPIVEDSLPSVNFYRSAWVVAFTAVKSWHQINKSYVQKTEDMEAKLKKAKAKIDVMPADVQALGDQWLATMRENERRIDRRFLHKWKSIRACLLEGKEREGDDVMYLPFRRLWENTNYITPLAKAYLLEQTLQDRLPNPRFPILGSEQSPMLLSITGSNSIPVTLECEAGAFVGKVKLARHDQPGDTRTWAFSTIRSKYFQDLSVRNVKSNASTTCEIEFTKGLKRDYKIHGDVKEPRIQVRRGQFYLDIIHTLRDEKKDSIKDRFWATWKNVSFFVDSNTKTTTDDIKQLIQGRNATGLRVMSVDLGINPLISYSVYALGSTRKGDDSFKVDGVGWANLVHQGQDGAVKSQSFRQKVSILMERIRKLKKIIRHRKAILNGKLSTHSAYLASMEDAFDFFGLEYTTDVVTLKRWCLGEMSDIRTKYGELRNSPHRWVGVMTEQVEWAALVREFIRLMQTWKYGGKKKENAATDAKRRSWVQDTDFKAYRKYLNSYKKDIIKKIASLIRDKCLEHGVSILLMEDLENFTFSVERAKGTNNMLEIWSPNTTIQWIKNACQAHGIFVLTIDPRDTSRLDPQTGEYGYRNKVAKEVLVVRRNGQLVMLNSDEEAAKNLQKRFWTKFDDLHRIDCVVDPQTGSAAPIGLKSRATRYFESRLGTATVMIQDGKVQPTKNSYIKGITKDVDADEGEDEDKKVAYYRHGDRWLPREEHYKVVDSLFEDLQASPLVEAQKYVSRVKALQKKGKRKKPVMSGG